MAKRKASRAGRKKAGVSRKAAGRTRAKARKTAPRRTAKAAKKTARARKAGRKATAPRARASARKAATRKAVRRAAPKAAPRQTSRRSPATAARKQSAPASRRSSGQAAAKRTATPSKVEVRKAPGLNRERRVINDDDIVQSTPPSSLDLDRTASSARSGRRTLRDRYAEHTETGPALTGRDVDADWQSAYSVGDEAPGGDNPTPDQDIEELKGADKVAKRDKSRWELDPASSDDWEDR